MKQDDKLEKVFEENGELIKRALEALEKLEKRKKELAQEVIEKFEKERLDLSEKWFELIKDTEKK